MVLGESYLQVQWNLRSLVIDFHDWWSPLVLGSSPEANTEALDGNGKNSWWSCMETRWQCTGTQLPLAGIILLVLFLYWALTHSGSHGTGAQNQSQGDSQTTHLWLFYLLPFRAAPMAYGGSQARGWIWAVAAGLRYSHSNTGSQPCLWTRSQLNAGSFNPMSKTRDQTCVLMVTSQILFCWATRGTPQMTFFWLFFCLCFY